MLLLGVPVPVPLLLLWLLSSSSAAAAEQQQLDLSAATIVLAQPAPERAHVYAQLLADEVYQRTALRWPVVNGNYSATASSAVIQLSARSTATVDWASARPEGFALSVSGSTVSVVGEDSRGLLYGIGRLLREMNLTLVENYYTPRRAGATLPAALSVSSAPARPMRGIQIGYRPKTNSYDGLTPALFEQYVVDLAFFGCNQIELIPHAFDDAPFSPHMALDHLTMNTEMSRILDKYDLNVSLWFPACDPQTAPDTHANSTRYGCVKGDFKDPSVMASAIWIM